MFKYISALQSILSEGQQQKVILARALANDIDKVSSNKILSELLTGNKTIVMISHDLTENQKNQFNQKIYLEKKMNNKC